MLKPYTFVVTDHQKIHSYVLDFFERMLTTNASFNDNIFHPEFLTVVKRHRTILQSALENIYNTVTGWTRTEKNELMNHIWESNKIKDICSGQATPLKLDSQTTGVHADIRILFLNLYKQVLNSGIIKEELNLTLRGHFDQFRKENKDITLCPFCGITELKTEFDDNRDPYDHYLPKSLYPLSSINFSNLIPTCSECNSSQIKGDKDVISIANGHLFNPFDSSLSGIDIEFHISADAINIEDVAWSVNLTSRDGLNNETITWRTIYNIDSRYIGFIKGRIKKWFTEYWQFTRIGALSTLNQTDKQATYLEHLQHTEDEGLSFIKRPALNSFLDTAIMARAEQEARLYS